MLRKVLGTVGWLSAICPERSEHNPPPAGGHNPRGEAPSTYPPLNPLNLLNPLNPHAEGVSIVSII